MARPFLADAFFVQKAAQGRSQDINTCIGCNPACLDNAFDGKLTSCLVNPRACHETELVSKPAATPKRLAVVGAGPAGLAFAVTAADRGHLVTLFDAADQIGGQFNLAKRIPGKEEFHETIRYFSHQLRRTGVELVLGRTLRAHDLTGHDIDEVIIATGVKPRRPLMEGMDHPKVLGYLDVLQGRATVGKRVAIIGAGGIGFDVAEYLSHQGPSTSQNIEAFMQAWGVDMGMNARGGIEGVQPRIQAAAREVHLLQRSTSKVGGNLGRTTGWIHRSNLLSKGVRMLGGCTYERVDDQGLHFTVDGEKRVLDVDHVVICAGQEPLRDLVEGLNKPYHLIGGADVAVQLDAKRAIDQATRLALVI